MEVNIIIILRCFWQQGERNSGWFSLKWALLFEMYIGHVICTIPSIQLWNEHTSSFFERWKEDRLNRLQHWYNSKTCACFMCMVIWTPYRYSRVEFTRFAWFSYSDHFICFHFDRNCIILLQIMQTVLLQYTWPSFVYVLLLVANSKINVLPNSRGRLQCQRERERAHHTAETFSLLQVKKAS